MLWIQKVYCMALVLLTKDKTPKLSFYEKKILLETIFFSENGVFKNDEY